MTKVKKSISIEEDASEKVLAYPVPSNSNDFSYRVTHIVDVATSLLKETRKELRNYFTVQEATLITESCKAIFYFGSGSAKNALESAISNELLFHDSGKKWSVELDVIIAKINALTEFQAYSVIASAWEYWNKVEAFKTVNVAISRSFLIDETEE